MVERALRLRVAAGGDVLVHAGGDAALESGIDLSGGGLRGVGGAVRAVEVVMRYAHGADGRGNEVELDAGVKMLDRGEQQRIFCGLQVGLAGGDIQNRGPGRRDVLGVERGCGNEQRCGEGGAKLHPETSCSEGGRASPW